MMPTHLLNRSNSFLKCLLGHLEQANFLSSAKSSLQKYNYDKFSLGCKLDMPFSATYPRFSKMKNTPNLCLKIHKKSYTFADKYQIRSILKESSNIF